MVVLWLKRLVAGLSSRWPGFAPGSVPVGFVVDKVALGHVIVIPLLLHTHLSPPHEVCDSSDQAEHYHTLGPKLGASTLTLHLAGTEKSIIIMYYIRHYIVQVTEKASLYKLQINKYCSLGFHTLVIFFDLLNQTPRLIMHGAMPPRTLFAFVLW
jgi:hypothetical protein